MCMFSSLPPVATTLFLIGTGLALFSFPLIDMYRRWKSPLRVYFRRSVGLDTLEHSLPSTSLTLILTNTRSAITQIDAIGSGPVHESPESSPSHEIQWLDIEPSILPLILNPNETQAIPIPQESSISPQSSWFFTIDGKLHTTMPNSPSFLRRLKQTDT